MTAVKYPFAVKYGGVDYKPGAVIEVENAAEHVKRGAKEIEVKRASGRRKAEATDKLDMRKTE